MKVRNAVWNAEPSENSEAAVKSFWVLLRLSEHPNRRERAATLATASTDPAESLWTSHGQEAASTMNAAGSRVSVPATKLNLRLSTASPAALRRSVPRLASQESQGGRGHSEGGGRQVPGASAKPLPGTTRNAAAAMARNAATATESPDLPTTVCLTPVRL